MENDTSTDYEGMEVEIYNTDDIHEPDFAKKAWDVFNRLDRLLEDEE